MAVTKDDIKKVNKSDIKKKDDSSRKPATEGYIGISSKFAALNRLITRDLNNNTTTPTFSLYSKDDITTYLSNPYTYEKQLRRAVPCRTGDPGSSAEPLLISMAQVLILGD